MIAAILAGGRSSRFGEEKLLYRVDGKPLITHTIERLVKAENIEEVVVITFKEKEHEFKKLGLKILIDKFKIGPIGGVYTALVELGDVFIAAGDMPNINPEFVDYIIKKFHRSRPMVCVPLWPNGYLEPLHAAYSEEFLPVLENQIKKREYMLGKAIKNARTCYIQIESLPLEWRESLFNINTKRDLKKFKGASRE
ncbi:molybdenum cofactor guanylyltransferase MobA [Thermococcus argininiproducens]|uniref:Probable molybdenum cofactor guanylyltransferase n=1 Tax=Thermococcus argininiproducens TaxID=2866384 RepID=A0A9E7M963_9EURY|nr:molybdenum cofactor guanylyltransferase MobA [Thermococcus argininiproducens]USG99328.1 molybdenum cofactor guanylyltransferase MobA [Thermococcus argininiproducens]